MSEVAERSGVDVMNTRGMSPPFWGQRRVVFFANLLGLFFGNDEETAMLAGEVGEIDTYGGRLVPILDLLYRGGRGGNNLLVLEGTPQPELCRYFEGELGLSLPEIRVLSHREYERIGRGVIAGEGGCRTELANLFGHTDGSIDGYVTDEILESVAVELERETVCPRSGSWRGNNKLLLHRFLESAGLPVFDTEFASSADEIGGCLERLRSRGFRSAAVKSQIGASGVGIAKLPTGAGGRSEVPGSFFYEGECMVQGWIEAGLHGVVEVRSPSVQMFAGEDRVYLYDLTEQILSHQSVHEGNVSPPPYIDGVPGLAEELFRQAAVVGEWLHRQGYRGTASVDFLVAPAPGKRAEESVYVCEANARITGATYPSVLARHFLPGGAWLMRNLRFGEEEKGERLLELLAEHGHLFSKGAARGVLPINFNASPDGGVGKGQFLCLAETPNECVALLARAENDLPVEWDYVRD